jgi:positive regulator of sigma E activity
VGSRPEVVRALLTSASPRGVALHDTVRISLPESSFLRGVALLYGLPLGSTIAAAALAQGLWVTPDMAPATADLGVVVSAVAGLLAGLALLRLQHHRDSGDPSRHPVVTERLPGTPD